MTFSSGDLAPPIDPVTESTARVNVRAILRSVSLTLGPAPLGNKPIRGIAGGVRVIDSRTARMLHEHGRLPIYLFPREEVRTDLLEPSGTRTSSENKGEARWRFKA